MEERFESFTALITSLGRSIRRIKTEEMADYHLKSQHVSCLYYLYKEEALTAKELCDLCEEDKANVSRSIDFLETNGYLVCESPVRKRYRSPLTLTEKGKEVGAYIAARIDMVLAKSGEGVSDEERATMYRCLRIINRNLQALCDTYTE